MNRLYRASLLVAGLALLAPAATAQVDPAVTGRNDHLETAFVGLAQQASAHAVKLERGGDHVGYGVVVDEGFVLTAESVVKRPGRYEAVTADGARLAATLAGRNRRHDVALLRLEGEAPAPIALGSSADLFIGQFVVTVGTEARPLAAGVVSATNRPVTKAESGPKNILMGLFSDGNEGALRDYEAVIQHDGPIAPDHFGSALIDREGRLVGINVANPFRGSSHAVGIDEIETVMADLKAGTPERPRTGDDRPTRDRPRTPAGGQRPWVGISVVDAPDDALHGVYAFGLLVRQAEGPAAAAGLEAGDVVVEIDGQRFASLDAFADLVKGYAVGDEIELTLIREAKVQTVSLTIGAR